MSEQRDCPACGGTGQFTENLGTTLTLCPSCLGSGKQEETVEGTPTASAVADADLEARDQMWKDRLQRFIERYTMCPCGTDYTLRQLRREFIERIGPEATGPQEAKPTLKQEAPDNPGIQRWATFLHESPGLMETIYRADMMPAPLSGSYVLYSDHLEVLGRQEARIEELEAALFSCAEAAGEDISEGRAPTWPDVTTWAVRAVKELRKDNDEGVEGLMVEVQHWKDRAFGWQGIAEGKTGTAPQRPEADLKESFSGRSLMGEGDK